MSRKQKLYFIGSLDGECVKVGVAYDPAKRCRNLQVGNPLSLRVLHQLDLDDAQGAESKAHYALRAHLIRGEWFAIGFKAALDIVEAALQKPIEEQDLTGETRAPPGQCPYCDRYRAYHANVARKSRHRLERYRSRAKQQEPTG